MRDHLAEFKIPRMIIQVKELPRTTATRKIRRSELAKYALDLIQHRKPSRLPDQLSESLNLQPRFWPALLGRRPLSYGRLARKVAGRHRSPDKSSGRELFGNLPHLLSDLLQGHTLCLDAGLPLQPGNTGEDMQTTLGDNIALHWIHDGHERLVHYEEIEIAADWFSKSFPLDPESVVFLDTIDADPELLLAAVVAAITNGATLHIPDKGEARSASALLGSIHRHRVTHLLIGNRFIEQVLYAENHWNGSFLESELNCILWAGSQIKRELFLQFAARFGITPRHVYKTQSTWHATLDEKLFSEIDERVIWGTLQSLAAEIFSVDGDLLAPDSAAENVQGWDSLAFVRLVAAAEERFGVRMKPRDIMSITTLGDMERLIERRMR